MNVFKISKILFLAVALVSLSSCTSNSREKETIETSTSSTRNTESATSSSLEDIASRYQKFEDINQGNQADEIYEKFIKSVKDDSTYGDNPLLNKSLTIVLYNTNCPDCTKTEQPIMQRLKEAIGYSPILMEVITKQKDFEYNAVGVDITEEVPEWLKSIPSIADSSGKYHTPTIAVVTPKKVDGKLYWDMMKFTISTDPENIRNTINYFNDDVSYKAFMENQPVISDETTVK